MQPHTGTCRATNSEGFTLRGCSCHGPDLAAHRGQRGQHGGSGRVQERAHPFSSAQPMPWVVSMLTRGRKNTESCLRCEAPAVPRREWPQGAPQTEETRGDRSQTGQVFAWVRVLPGVLGVSYLMGVRKLLPSIPERERVPASAAASWRDGEEHSNLPCREEGERQPCPGAAPTAAPWDG